MNALRVVFMGTPGFAVGILNAITEGPHQVVGVVTVADKPAGRGQLMHESAVKQRAKELNLPVLQPEKLKDEAFLTELKALEADVFVVVAFRMLPKEVWQMPKLGTFNLHASLLPDYRGAAPINWTIINGDSESGLSTFLIDEQIDTGGVLLQERMAIGENETVGDLHDRMIPVGGVLVNQTLDGLSNGELKPKPQSEFTDSPMRPAPKLFKENTLVDWSKSMKDIHHFCCGLSPYPSAWTKWSNSKGEIKTVKLFKTTVDTTKISEGIQLSADKQFIYVSGPTGTLTLHEFQLEGKKRLSAKDWLVGNKVEDWTIIEN